MSTTFGITKIDNEGDLHEIEIAFRSNGKIKFTNPLGEHLYDDIEVTAFDNSPQGIHTIGDIKKKIKQQTKSSIQMTTIKLTAEEKAMIITALEYMAEDEYTEGNYTLSDKIDELRVKVMESK